MAIFSLKMQTVDMIIEQWRVVRQNSKDLNRMTTLARCRCVGDCRKGISFPGNDSLNKFLR